MSNSLGRLTNIEQFDGSKWRQYETPESIIVLTNAGRHLFAQKGLSSLIHRYIADAQAGDEPALTTRRFLADGANGRVFSVGDSKLAMKEKFTEGDQLLPALYRMDRMKAAIEYHCPRWIDMPDHYGVLVSKSNVADQYLLMEKIDDGVTVGDIIKGPREPHLEETIAQQFGGITPRLQAEVAERFEHLKGSLRKALVSEYLSPDTYLPDLDNSPYNVALERLNAPVAGSMLRYWVIDQ